MPRYQRPEVSEGETFCRCAPSHSNFHGKKGCEHDVTAFIWNRRAQDYDIVNLHCRCQVVGKIPEVGMIVLEDEKE